MGVNVSEAELFVRVRHVKGGRATDEGLGDYRLVHHYERGGIDSASPVFTADELREGTPVHAWIKEQELDYCGPLTFADEVAVALEEERQSR